MGQMIWNVTDGWFWKSRKFSFLIGWLKGKSGSFMQTETMMQVTKGIKKEIRP